MHPLLQPSDVEEALSLSHLQGKAFLPSPPKPVMPLLLLRTVPWPPLPLPHRRHRTRTHQMLNTGWPHLVQVLEVKILQDLVSSAVGITLTSIHSDVLLGPALPTCFFPPLCLSSLMSLRGIF